MKSHRKMRLAFLSAVCIYSVALMTVFSMAETKSRVNGHKVKITGPIVVHEGDMLQILNEKDGSVHGFKVTDETTIRCEEGFLHRNTVMHPSALVPALTVEVEGIGTPQDMPEAKTIKVDPDTFALTVGQDKQGGDLCRKPAQGAGRYHGIKTLFSSLLPPI
ncbi:MAG: hypothetical protein ABSD13_17025 [Candidatus Korobacteraceae bacterium]